MELNLMYHGSLEHTLLICLYWLSEGCLQSGKLANRKEGIAYPLL